jgi:hypothetical protein
MDETACPDGQNNLTDRWVKVNGRREKTCALGSARDLQRETRVEVFLSGGSTLAEVT